MWNNISTTFSSVSGKSKKRKSIVISNPIPCNTAFPTDHVSIHSTENAKDPVYAMPIKTQSVSEEAGVPQEGSVSSKDVNSSDSDLSSSGVNTPQRQSVCDNESSDGSAESQSPEEAEVEEEADGGEHMTSQSEDSALGALKSEGSNHEESEPSDSANGDAAQSPEPEEASDPPSEEAMPKPAPIPAPRASFRSTDQRPLLTKAEKEETPSDQEDLDCGDNCSTQNPPGFLYKVRCPMRCKSTALLSNSLGRKLLLLESHVVSMFSISSKVAIHTLKAKKKMYNNSNDDDDDKKGKMQ